MEINVISVSKTIGKETILSNVSFKVNQGDIFALVGPNGGGENDINTSDFKLI